MKSRRGKGLSSEIFAKSTEGMWVKAVLVDEGIELWWQVRTKVVANALHVYDANGKPGLFNNLSGLSWGDKVIVHAYGQAYVYEVRTVEKYVEPGDTSSVTKHEDYPWLSLVTCRGYDRESDSYRWRVVVRAVQTIID